MCLNENKGCERTVEMIRSRGVDSGDEDLQRRSWGKGTGSGLGRGS